MVTVVLWQSPLPLGSFDLGCLAAPLYCPGPGAMWRRFNRTEIEICDTDACCCLGVLPVLALGVVAGCGSSSKSSSPTTSTTSSGGTTVPTTAGSGTTIHVTLSDKAGIGSPMTLVATPATGPAGDVTFVVKNAGTIDHEMIVLKTSVPYNKIPVADAGDPPAPVKTGADKVDEGTQRR
jgi:hypothetical protein